MLQSSQAVSPNKNWYTECLKQRLLTSPALSTPIQRLTLSSGHWTPPQVKDKTFYKPNLLTSFLVKLPKQTNKKLLKKNIHTFIFNHQNIVQVSQRYQVQCPQICPEPASSPTNQCPRSKTFFLFLKITPMQILFQRIHREHNFQSIFWNLYQLAKVSKFEQHSCRVICSFLSILQLEYGTIFCFGSNLVGRQEQPCVFHIIPASK